MTAIRLDGLCRAGLHDECRNPRCECHCHSAWRPAIVRPDLPGGSTKEMNTMFGKKKLCDHQSSAPFKARCSKEPGHRGDHGARGLRWGADGRIKFGGGAGKGGKR